MNQDLHVLDILNEEANNLVEITFPVSQLPPKGYKIFYDKLSNRYIFRNPEMLFYAFFKTRYEALTESYNNYYKCKFERV
jgi:hypothetical protein